MGCWPIQAFNVLSIQADARSFGSGPFQYPKFLPRLNNTIVGECVMPQRALVFGFASKFIGTNQMFGNLLATSIKTLTIALQGGQFGCQNKMTTGRSA